MLLVSAGAKEDIADNDGILPYEASQRTQCWGALF